MPSAGEMIGPYELLRRLGGGAFIVETLELASWHTPPYFAMEWVGCV